MAHFHSRLVRRKNKEVPTTKGSLRMFFLLSVVNSYSDLNLATGSEASLVTKVLRSRAPHLGRAVCRRCEECKQRRILWLRSISTPAGRHTQQAVLSGNTSDSSRFESRPGHPTISTAVLSPFPQGFLGQIGFIVLLFDPTY
jgi:hypothetical protein